MKIRSLFSLRKWIMYFLGKPFAKNIADEKYIKLKFYATLGKRLNLESPKTFNEKLQWLKLHDRKPIYTDMVDKYEAKNHVADIIGEKYIIPTLGVWDSFDEIDFDSLPEQFVLKCTHDSGGLVICRDKKGLNKASAKAKIERSLKRDYYLTHREWPYKNVKRRIIAEKYLEQPCGADTDVVGLTDYKFYCFNGKPKFLYVSKGLENHNTAKISFLTLDWEFAPFKRSDFRGFDVLPEKPTKLSEMIEIATKLSKDIAFVRVDLYQVGENIYFSELTFSPCAGMMPFEPEHWDEKLGEWIDIADIN